MARSDARCERAASRLFAFSEARGFSPLKGANRLTRQNGDGSIECQGMDRHFSALARVGRGSYGRPRDGRARAGMAVATPQLPRLTWIWLSGNPCIPLGKRMQLRIIPKGEGLLGRLSGGGPLLGQGKQEV